MLKQLALTLSARALADVLHSGIAVPDVETIGKSVSDEAEIQVLVIIARHDRPQLHLFQKPIPLIPPLREIERNILESCGTEPMPIKQVAARAGYGCNPHFREAVYRLLELGLIVRVRGGIRRA